MNMRLFGIFGGLALVAATGCVVVDNTGNTGGNGGSSSDTTSVGNTGPGGAGGAGGAGQGGAGGGVPACDDMLTCATATTDNPMNLQPCSPTSAQLLKDYQDCVCQQADCMSGTDMHGICAATPDYDAVPQGACQTAVLGKCGTQATACTGDF